MAIRLKSRISLLLLAFAVVMFVFPAMAFAQDAGDPSGAPPTIASDKADYPPGATVVLTGSNWQPGESVNIVVNDDAGKTWTLDDNVTADDSGAIRYEFQLPDWFVATYKVTATGAQSGVATTSFTDGVATLVGKHNCANAPVGVTCDTGFVGNNLNYWKELEQIPMRLQFDATRNAPTTYENFTIPFDHVQNNDPKVMGIQNLYDWTGSNAEVLKAELTDTSGSEWAYTLSVKKLTTASAVVNFKANLAAGAHYFTGSSLALGGSDVGGRLQIAKPGAVPGTPDMFVRKSGIPTAAPGSIIPYVLEYGNKPSTDTAVGVQLTDELPSGVTYVGGCSTSDGCSRVGNFVTWNLDTLNPNQSGSKTLQVRVNDAMTSGNLINTARIRGAQNDLNPADNDATFTTTVNSNSAPVARDDSGTTPEDTPVTVNVLANDTDSNAGDDLDIAPGSVTQPANGQVNCDNETGACTYTPPANFNGTTTFKYKATDGTANSSEATVTITVNAVNDAPSFTKGSDQSVKEDAGAQTVSGWASAILAGPANESSQSLSFVITGNTNSAIFSSGPAISSGGNLTYTAAADKNGTAAVSVKIKDDGGTPGDASDDLLSAEQTFTITVRPVNDAPSFTAGPNQSVNEDSGPQTVDPWATNILKGPADEGGQAVDFVITDNTNSALFSSGPAVSSNGTLSYTPAANKNGTATITLKIHDDGGIADGGVNESATQTFTITVDSINDDPVANNDSATIAEDTNAVVDVIGNDTDVDGDGLSVTSFTQPADGTVTEDPDGKLKYAPNNNFNGTDTFDYTISDEHGGNATASVTIRVTPVNDRPVAADDSYSVDEDGALTKDAAAGILGNDLDVDSASLTAALVDEPAHGTLNLDPDGSFIYTPRADFNGTDTFTYKANDGSLDSNVATVTITVKAVNDAPVAKDLSGENEQVVTPEDTPKNITLEASDVDSNDLTFSIVNDPGHGTLSGSGADQTYTPGANYNGPDTFTFEVCDKSTPEPLCDVGRIDINVTPVNDAPVAEADEYTTSEDGALTVVEAEGVLSNDSDVDKDLLTVTLTSGPANGTLKLNPDGSFTYTPSANFNGEDSFTYTVSDGNNGTADATVKVTIVAVNDAPVADNDSATTPEDKATDLDVLANDTDVDNTHGELSVSSFTQPSHGTVSQNSDGTLEYNPKANYNGPDSFTYRAKDNDLDSNVARVSITVNAVNDAPVPQDDSITINEDAAGNGNVLTNDTDVENDNLTATKVDGPTHGQLTLNPDGSFAYTPNDDYYGSDSFTYRANDGTDDSNLATVTITVKAVNDAPVAADDTATTPEDTPVVILAADLFLNDSTGPANESGQKLTIIKVSGATDGQAEINGEGDVIFTPAANYVGEASFDYTVCDDGGTAYGGVACFEGTATVKVTVSAVNDAPVADNDSDTTPEDTPKNIVVLANDTDVENDSLTAVKVSDPTHGTVAAGPDGTLTYTPNKDFNGTDSFTYKASDGDLASNIVTVTVTVTPVNDEPKAVYDAYNVDEDKTLTIAAPGVLGNDTDVDDDSLTAAQVVGTANGQLTLNADGSLTYKPNADYYGPDSFTYKVSDGKLDSNVAMVDITVNPVNDSPVISSVNVESPSVDEGSPATIKVTATDLDNQLSDLRYGFDCDNANGFEKGPQAADEATCTFDDNGTYRVNVRVSDPLGGSATGSTDVTVRNVAPTLTGPISVSPQQALVGQSVKFTAPNPVDPSQADRTAGFTWDWYANGATTPFLTGLGLNPLVSNQFSANKCGAYSVSATATDKDGGVSNAAKANASVNVSNGLFRAPLVDGTANLVQKGQVVPVKVFVGCGATTLTGLTPSIQLLKGNVTPENESDYTTVTASVSSADTAGFMRPIDGGYIYNLRVPDAAAGTQFTIRVNPFGTTETPNPASSQMYSLLKIRK